MAYFLYNGAGSVTGRVLAQALGIPAGTRAPSHSVDYLVRWGTATRVDRRPSHVINRADAIERATDKLHALSIMRDANVRVPPFDTDPQRVTFPALGRRVHHTQGRDVALALQRADVRTQQRDFWVTYIPTAQEWRVHVFGGEPIYLQQKVLDRAPDAEHPLSAMWIRNYENGYVFRQRSLDRDGPRQQMIEQAVNAVNALGLTFGAVDVLLGDDGQAYVLEVNTAPACAPRTGRAYVDAIAARIGVTPNHAALDALAERD